MTNISIVTVKHIETIELRVLGGPRYRLRTGGPMLKKRRKQRSDKKPVVPAVKRVELQAVAVDMPQLA